MVVKICGITNLEDARAAIDAGATAVGFNFYPPSPRFIDTRVAAEIASEMPGHVLRVGVFVDLPVNAQPPAFLDIVQIHGLAPADPPWRTWKAFRVDDRFSLALIETERCDAVLLDAPSSKLHGGTGCTFNWRHAAGARVNVIIAGGLDETNVAEAIRQARPWGVDACSRIESAPGRKDHARMAGFIAAALREFHDHALTP